jgi:alpha-tubulin suppressor-like RCC1 family protein
MDLTSHFKILVYDQSDIIDKISFGENHNLFKTLKGKVFGIGDNSMGQLGHQCESNKFLDHLYEIKIQSVNDLAVADIATG